MVPCEYDYPNAPTHYISKTQICDGSIDCKYGPDELDCNLTSGMSCIRNGLRGWIPPSYICDSSGWKDCDSGEYDDCDSGEYDDCDSGKYDDCDSGEYDDFKKRMDNVKFKNKFSCIAYIRGLVCYHRISIIGADQDNCTIFDPSNPNCEWCEMVDPYYGAVLEPGCLYENQKCGNSSGEQQSK